MHAAYAKSSTAHTATLYARDPFNLSANRRQLAAASPTFTPAVARRAADQGEQEGGRWALIEDG